mmetsp:Transcript_19368/g.39830  ORF Transcript_19368/g.39830 Transcript_19368/m.39830 type:complete len:239 (-) Transcript_19368:1076-1792(-)
MKQFLRTFISEKIPRSLHRKITRGNVPVAGNDRCRCNFYSEQNGLSLADVDMNGCNSKLLKVSGSHSYVNGSLARRFSSSGRPDPFARRPTPKCDPYGQSGKPLTLSEASSLLRTVDTEWRIMMQEEDNGHEHDGYDENCIPFAITRDFLHEDYMHGARFSTHVAAVAQMNAQHFPHQVVLNRRLESRKKSWKIFTQVVCRTHVLQGLSHHDFYLATLIDIEIQRPEIRGLIDMHIAK